MSVIENCEVEYITSSRSIETIRLKNELNFIYVYNYEGNYFRLFTEIIELIKFFQFGLEPKHSFSSDYELDCFIDDYQKT